MGTYNEEKSLLGKLITWIVVALVAIAVLKLAFWVVGVAFGLGAWLIFTFGPILLVGWVVMKIIRYFNRPSGYPNA